MQIGKKVFDDLYIHIKYIDELRADLAYEVLINLAISFMDQRDLKSCNVLKINLRRKRLSFLQYDNFEEDAFPTLNSSWIFLQNENKINFRSYSSSLNPPILHRKELLVGIDNQNRKNWEEITKSAEEIGLFRDTSTIGFKLNWLKLISNKGYQFINDKFIPLGNHLYEDINDADLIFNFLPNGSIQRHLTALSRSSLSAPIQLLLSHGLISKSIELFDYGCGRGDDLRTLEILQFKCNGWDPYYAKNKAINPADIVNLGFVINVIEDPAERIEAVQNAFSIAKTAMVVSVMLFSKERSGKAYSDGVLTSRNTFQKYFTQIELKYYLKKILNIEPIMIGPGIALIFKDNDAEQRFLFGRYRSSNVAKRLLNARLSPRSLLSESVKKIRIQRVTKSEREFEELKPLLEKLWVLILDLGRFPEPLEIANLNEILEKTTINRAYRLIKTYFNLDLLDKSAKTRSDEIKLFFAAKLFSKKSTFRDFEPRLKADIKYFFKDFKNANKEALKLLIDSSSPENILKACKEAAAEGLGWLEENGHSLQLHSSLVERLPSVLRAYVNCGLILWDNISDFQLVKIHVTSGKLTLLKYQDFDSQAIPKLIKRIKINIRKLDYDVFEYEEPEYPPSALIFKSRYMHEDLQGFAEQILFYEQLEATGILEELENTTTLEKIQQKLNFIRLEISGLNLQRSTSLPELEQLCGQNLTYKDLIHCGTTQFKLGIPNIPKNPETYNSLYKLSSLLLDPIIDYFGSIRLTYGFCSIDLASKIKSRIAPKLDQHSSHEYNRLGKHICARLGAAVDFIVDDEDMVEVSQWIFEHLQFDRMYIYGRNKPIHISYSSSASKQITLMLPIKDGKLIPKVINVENINTYLLKNSLLEGEKKNIN